MTADPQAPLRDFAPQHEFFVGIDSDGCAFDTMEIKHKECFIPNIIKHWDLQPVSKYAREAAEFVNLYSKWRGINRFPALLMVFDLLAERAEVQRRGVAMPEVPTLRQWVETETKLGNPTLKVLVEKTPDAVLERTLGWSEAVNATIADMVYGVPPFPFVRQSLEKMCARADAIVVSATPGEALQREWDEHDIAKHCAVIAGPCPHDRRRPRRLQGRPRQRLPLLPHQARERGRILGAFPRRGTGQVLLGDLRGRLREDADRRVRRPSARGPALEALTRRLSPPPG